MSRLTNEIETEQRQAGLDWTVFLHPAVDERRIALAVREDDGWLEWSYGELKQAVTALSSYLIETGVQRGDRVAILSEAGPQWTIAFLAAIRSGVVAVPLDTQLTTAELLPLLGEARPRLLFVSSALADARPGLWEELSETVQVIQLDNSTDSPYPNLSPCQPCATRPGRERYPDEIVIMVYTSGTTGAPRGVLLTLRNLLFQLDQMSPLFPSGPQDVSLSILPLNHLLELTGGLLAMLRSEGQVCQPRTLYPAELMEAARERRATRMVVVPLFLRLLQDHVEREVRHSWVGRRLGFWLAFRLARWAPANAKRRWLFRGLHRRLGGSLRDLFSGGAALDGKTERFFVRLGFAVWQGYGLTETSPVVAVNRPGAFRPGSVGRPLPGVEVRIAALTPGATQGEILTRGPHVMQGYYGPAGLTQQVLDPEGWLHTGDLGYLDRQGFLYITGRLKNLVVLAGGKKVNPAEVEEALVAGPLVQEGAVVGRRARLGLRAGTEEVWAVMVPTEALAQRLGGRLELLETELREEVRRLTADLAPYKRPTQVVVRLEPLPRTSTRKVCYPMLHQWLDHLEEVRQ